MTNQPPTTDPALTEERVEAWGQFLARYEVEPTMGWVHAAFNAGFDERSRLPPRSEEREIAQFFENNLVVPVKDIARVQKRAEQAEHQRDVLAEALREIAEHRIPNDGFVGATDAWVESVRRTARTALATLDKHPMEQPE